MGIEQYAEMAGKFAFYCDSVYFDYQGDRGTVTILDIRVAEAIYYSRFIYSMDDVYDFAAGTILTASGEILADVNAYIAQ